MQHTASEELKDRVVVVTGGARGIGRAFTDAFAAAGAKVVATDISWSGADPVDASNVLALTMDVTQDADVDRAYAQTIERFGTVDVLINNAALRQRILFPPTGRTTTLETKDADWEKSFAVNVFGPLKVIRRFIRPMLEKKRGSILNVVSSGVLHFSHGGAYYALRPNSREMPYMSGKAALATMSFYLADEVRADNVAVNILIPGHTRTTGFDEQNLARMEAGLMAHVGVQPLRPDHMVPLATFLATQDARSGNTGKMWDVMLWNLESGHGSEADWQDASFSYDALRAKLGSA